MAGERIEVKVWKNPFTCEDCNFGPRPKCGFKIPCLPADYFPTRQQAIEFMAEAIWKSDNKDLPISYWEKQMKEAKERYLRRAEAALDALIKQGD